MTPDVRELYQQLIVDHSKSPRNCRVIEGADEPRPWFWVLSVTEKLLPAATVSGGFVTGAARRSASRT